MKRFFSLLFVLIFLTSCANLLDTRKDPKNVDRIIYYSPHQDDEILSMGPAIRRDLSKGKEVYMLLISDGSTSSLYEPINKRLEEEGYSPFSSRQEFSEARTREMRKSLEELGLNLNHFYTANIPDDGSVTPEKVYEEGMKLMKELGEGRYHHKTLGEFEFEENGTHIACCQGVEKIIEETKEPGTFFYGVCVEKMDPLPEDKIQPRTEKDLEKVEEALKAYNIWAPENGFYAIGYQSVGYAFNRELENPTSYIIKEVNVD